MSAFFGRLLNVRSNEWPRLLILYIMALVALTGINWGEAIVQAAFLQPWAFGFCPGCSSVALPAPL